MRSDKAVTRRRPADLPAKDAREAILQAAADLFSERGFETTKMRDIAALAGLTVAAPYWHFESKEELYCAVYTAGIRAVQDAVLREMEGIQDPWLRLKAAAIA